MNLKKQRESDLTPQRQERGIVSLEMPHLQDAPVELGQIDEVSRFLHRSRNRLLDQDVQTQFHQRPGHFGVEYGGHRDDSGFGGASGFLQAGKDGAAKLGSHFRGSLRIRIEEPGQRHPRNLLEHAQVVLAEAARTDDSHGKGLTHGSCPTSASGGSRNFRAA